MILEEKYDSLISYIKSMKKAVIAFSGGVDSTFLLHVAKEALGENIIAVTMISPYIPKWEIEEAKELSEKLGVRHEFISTGIIEEIRDNPEDRCYLCKRAVFGKILEFAKGQKISYVMDGTNEDDMKDYRPGLKALQELEIVSPLKENEITKEDIRLMSKNKGLKTWDKPAYACLLTRIPYGTELKVEDFERIERAEVFLMDLGFKAVRVRSHGDLARIEVPSESREKLFDTKLLDKISEGIKEAGFTYVTLDMDGYKMGGFKLKSGE
ncbi:ATP-dependent sacrificial sulfur transferase LarE [Alkalibacter mobilis]|uniref:ATP-dependent sacrificial sulfur transferase LarE n=1 Tax=Alkalibacter mobilis TaxID=2787712 RepID=UPI0018A0F3B6|nr:ATP-dependent sacrificial sulfur transferase LarE [Alkalibacter mobilis]MBF7097359.1 ATP-dependent sacrificial sulfur transferase LarE [Alkalibacter mobilis]